jgi:hypothetical protein
MTQQWRKNTKWLQVQLSEGKDSQKFTRRKLSKKLNKNSTKNFIY